MQTVQDSNEIIVSALLQLSEDQQRSHVHIEDNARLQAGKYEVRDQTFSLVCTM